MKKILSLLVFLAFSDNAFSSSIQGNIDMLEVWANGNIAFTLRNTNVALDACNGQFVLNKSSNGTKNMYAALMTAKIVGKRVDITYSDTCGLAENYTSTEYIIPIYLHMLDN